MLDLVDFVFAFPFTEITGITITHITEVRWNMVSENKHENKSLAHLMPVFQPIVPYIFTQNK